LLKGKAKG